MNRNTELHFSKLPNLQKKRSIFDLSHKWQTSMNGGYITPMFLQEVLPGDTFDVKTNFVCRMTTPIKPVMDNAYIDLYFFFVPNRLVWDHWQEFMGENKEGAWDEDKTEYQIPGYYVQPEASIPQMSDQLWKALGLPINPNMTIPEEDAVSALPFRGYELIYNEYFRNQNIEPPVYIDKGDGNVEISSDLRYTGTGSALFGGKLEKAYKFADYFTNALPAPQKGDPVGIGLVGELPVNIEANGSFLFRGPNEDPSGEDFTVNLYARRALDDLYADIRSTMGTGLTSSLEYQSGLTGNTNLEQATLININDIRNAFAVQKQLEKDARGGTRYIEIIKTNFGITSSDARLQRPEYLGGGRYPINMQQVLQTSSSSDTTTPQGNTAAFSNTVESDKGFVKSFEEHGYIMGLAVIRTENTYYQGIDKHWSRKDRFDFYFPTFANIGEQPILNKEIYMGSSEANNNEVYGYQEAWAEYRFAKNRIANDLVNQEERIWDYAEDLSNGNAELAPEYLKENEYKIDQTLTATSDLIHQFRVDFYHNCKAVRELPMYSIPGLIDHN